MADTELDWEKKQIIRTWLSTASHQWTGKYIYGSTTSVVKFTEGDNAANGAGNFAQLMSHWIDNDV